MLIRGLLLSLQGHPWEVKHLSVKSRCPCSLMGCCYLHIQFSVWSQIWIFLQMQAKRSVTLTPSRIHVLMISLCKISASQRCEGHAKPSPNVGSICGAESVCLSRSQGTVKHHTHSPASGALRVKKQPMSSGKKSNHPSGDGLAQKLLFTCITS